MGEKGAESTATSVPGGTSGLDAFGTAAPIGAQMGATELYQGAAATQAAATQAAFQARAAQLGITGVNVATGAAGELGAEVDPTSVVGGSSGAAGVMSGVAATPGTAIGSMPPGAATDAASPAVKFEF